MVGKAQPSPALLMANARLLTMRQQHQQHEQTYNASSGAPGKLPDLSLLPAHLGWGSARITAVLRRGQRQKPQQATATNAPHRETPAKNPPANTTPHTDQPTDPAENWVKLYPDIGLGMLRQHSTAPGRLWLMLRYLDEAGCGTLDLDLVRQSLTAKTAALRLCGKRQLRNLLRDGEGIYWTRDKTRVWLRSAAKVAAALKVERLTGRPVALPVSAILQGIGAFRAHLYAAFHSGQCRETSKGAQASPLARETLASISGVGPSSQRVYEKRTRVKVQANFAIGETLTKEAQENRMWEKGRAAFQLTDYRGQQGQPGKSYLAWQLPNTYIGQHHRRPKGRQRRINRKLKDLVKNGTPGNRGKSNGTSLVAQGRRYFALGKAAAQAQRRSRRRRLYWRDKPSRNGRFQFWQVIEVNQ